MSTTFYLPGESGWRSAGSFSSVYLRLKIVRSYDAATNTSTLVVTLQHKSTAYGGSQYLWSGTGSGEQSYLLLPGGERVNLATDSRYIRNVSVNTWADMNGGSWTRTVQHAADGTASVTLGFYGFVTVVQAQTTARFNLATAAASFSEPRGSAISQLSASAETLGSLSLAVSRNDPANWHRATVRCGNAVLAVSEPFAEALSLSVPRSWFANFPNTASLSCTVSVQTYTDSGCQTALGDPATGSVAVTADALMRPALQAGYAAAAPDNTGTAAAGLSCFVSGVSRAAVTLDSSKLDMSAAVGATVASVAVTGGGETDTQSPYRTGVLTGEAAVTVTVTDSRGRTGTMNLTVQTLPYAPPTLSQLRIFRCLSDGTEDEDGTRISVKAAGSVSELDGENTLSLTAEWSENGGSWTQPTALQSGAASILGGGLDPDLRLDLRVTATDALANSAVTTVTLPPRVWAMKFRPNGQGVGFGMAPTEDRVLQLPAGWKIKVGDTYVYGN